MVRALLGLVGGAVTLEILAVVYGKWKGLHAWEFEPLAVGALAVGAVVGLGLGLLSARRRARRAA